MNHIILLTTFNRFSLLKQCLESIWNTVEQGTPLFVINDGSKKETRDFLHDCLSNGLVSHLINSRINMGITPSINYGIYMILDFIRFYNADNRAKHNPFISYIQDDMKCIKKDWPTHCINKFREAKKHIKPDFITGNPFSYDFKNHKKINTEIELEGAYYRESMPAKHMMAKPYVWEERTPIPTYRDGNVVRGHPHNGLGSCVDWWLIRDSKPSQTLCIEGIMEDHGQKKSTWQVF